jgi:DNA-binding CsgD family transcriptional regulator
VKITDRFLDVTAALQEVLKRDELSEVLLRGVRGLFRAESAGVRWIGARSFSRSLSERSLASLEMAHAAGFVCPVSEAESLILLVTRHDPFTRAEQALLDELRAHVVRVIARILEGEGQTRAAERAVACLAAAQVGLLFRTTKSAPFRPVGAFAEGLLAARAPDSNDLLDRIASRLEDVDWRDGGPTAEWTQTDIHGTLRFSRGSSPDGEFVAVEEIDREPERDAVAALGLPPRQAEILQWMSKGKSYPEIAAILGLSVHTVHEHVGALFRRLGVRDRRSAVQRLREFQGATRGDSPSRVAGEDG